MIIQTDYFIYDIILLYKIKYISILMFEISMQFINILYLTFNIL
jgi:hypothetical protein